MPGEIKEVEMQHYKIKIIIFLLIGFLFCTFVSIKEYCINLILFFLFFYILGIVIVYLEDQSSLNREFMNSVFIYGYIIRILAAIIIYYILLKSKGAPFLGGGDDVEYEMWGHILSERWIDQQYELPSITHPGYPVINGILYYIAHFLGNIHVLIPRFFNCLIGALIPIYVFKIAYRVYGVKIAKTSAWIAVLFPNFIYFSSLQLKDIIITFLFVFSVSYFLEYINTNKLRKFFVVAVSVILLSFFRYIYAVELAAIVIFTIFIFSFVRTKIGLNKKNLSYTLLIFMIIALLILLGVRGTLSNLINPTSLSPSSLIESYNVRSIYSFIGTTETANSLLFYFYEKLSLPLRTIIFPFFLMITPYPPWRAFVAADPLKIITFLNGMLWVSLLPFFILGLIFTIRKKTLISLPLIAVLLVVLITISISYFDERYRLPVMPYALIIAVAGIYQSLKYSWTKIYYIWFQFLLLMSYLVMKYHFISIKLFIMLLFGFIIYPIFKFSRIGVRRLRRSSF